MNDATSTPLIRYAHTFISNKLSTPEPKRVCPKTFLMPPLQPRQYLRTIFLATKEDALTNVAAFAGNALNKHK